jgi:PAS domain S-box-containing protein
MKNSGGMVAVTDASGTIMVASGNAEKILGLPSDAFVGKSVFILLQAEDLPRAKLIWSKALVNDQSLALSEDYWVEGKDAPVCLRVVVSNCLMDPEIDAMVVNLKDVTSTKNAEAAQTALLRSTTALVTAVTEAELYDDICQVVVDDSAFDLAWIGLSDGSQSLGIRLMASGGPIAYFDELNAFTGELPYVGPFSVAIKTKVVQIIGDIAKLPESVSWRSLALGHGFRSIAALPIGNDGVLAIYSKRVGTFSDEVVAVFRALVEDIDQGIAAIRSREDNASYLYRLEAGLEATVQAIAAASEMRDPYTAGHQRRVAELARAIAVEMGLNSSEVRGIYTAASIHDIGKLAVPSELLSKPGRLTPIEFELIKGHAQAGFDIVSGIDFPWPVGEAILKHHERLDGSGYPDGLMGDEIPLGVRILSVADVVEAMHARRPYREGLGIDAALEEIDLEKGILFDADVVEVCVRLFRDLEFEFSQGENLNAPS